MEEANRWLCEILWSNITVNLWKTLLAHRQFQAIREALFLQSSKYRGLMKAINLIALHMTAKRRPSAMIAILSSVTVSQMMYQKMLKDLIVELINIQLRTIIAAPSRLAHYFKKRKRSSTKMNIDFFRVSITFQRRRLFVKRQISMILDHCMIISNLDLKQKV